MTTNVSSVPDDVEFAQFTAGLITQTLDAVITAQLQQEERVRRLQEAAAFSPDRFAEESISTEDIEDELARLFPAAQYPQGVLPGAPYTPAAADQPEDPPILKLTGYTIKKGDWAKKDDGLVITDDGYKDITAYLRLSLATEQLTSVQQMMRRGIPRVIVDHGKINAKLFFSFTSGQQSTAVTGLKAAALPRLMVKTAELRRPEVARLTVNVVGEVEITFKTITE